MERKGPRSWWLLLPGSVATSLIPHLGAAAAPAGGQEGGGASSAPPNLPQRSSSTTPRPGQNHLGWARGAPGRPWPRLPWGGPQGRGARRGSGTDPAPLGAAERGGVERGGGAAPPDAPGPARCLPGPGGLRERHRGRSRRQGGSRVNPSAAGRSRCPRHPTLPGIPPAAPFPRLTSPGGALQQTPLRKATVPGLLGTPRTGGQTQTDPPTPGRAYHGDLFTGAGRMGGTGPSSPSSGAGRQDGAWAGGCNPQGVARTQIWRVQPGPSAQVSPRASPEHSHQASAVPSPCPLFEGVCATARPPVLPLAMALSPRWAAGAPRPGRAGGRRRCRCPAGRLAR